MWDKCPELWAIFLILGAILPHAYSVGTDLFRTVVTMARKMAHRLIKEKILSGP